MNAVLITVVLFFLSSITSDGLPELSRALIVSTTDNITINELDIETNDSLTDRHSHHRKKHDCTFVHGDFPIDLTDKEDPTKYFRCQQGASILFQCPAQLKFDEYVRGCIWFLSSPQAVVDPPTSAPCGCGNVKSKPTTTTQAPCTHDIPSTTPTPIPLPCGCETKPPTTTPKPTPAPCNHAPPSCGCKTTSPTTTPKPTPAPCNHASPSCGCVTTSPTTTPKPTPAPCNHASPSCGCVTTSPTTTPKPTPGPCNHAPPSCGCSKKSRITKLKPKPARCNHAVVPCGCSTKPTTTKPKPTPAPCIHDPQPCGCYSPKKPGQAPGPRPTSIAAITKCPLEQSNGPVFITHATDRTKFYQCSWGTAFECQCSDGLIFHIGLQACGWPQADHSKVIVANFDCFAYDSVAVLLPHANDLHKFYKIYQGVAYECCCPMSEVFKSDVRMCVNYDVPVCPEDLGDNIVYLTHPDHRLFYECAGGEVNLFYCSTGTFFHPDKKSCITAQISF